jgi:hypothetical protein
VSAIPETRQPVDERGAPVSVRSVGDRFVGNLVERELATLPSRFFTEQSI